MPDASTCPGVRSLVTPTSRAPCCRRCAAFKVLADGAGTAQHDGRAWKCADQTPITPIASVPAYPAAAVSCHSLPRDLQPPSGLVPAGVVFSNPIHNTHVTCATHP